MSKTLEVAYELSKILDKGVDKGLPEEIASVVKFHSKGAALAAISQGWVPAIGPTAASLASVGFIWSMYGRINKKIDMPIKKNMLKTVASGIATNIATQTIGLLAISTAVSLIPGLGGPPAAILMGTICYVITAAAGYIYLKILTRIFKAGEDPSSLTVDNLKKVADEIIQNENIKSVIKEAKKEYKVAKARGEIRGEKPL